MNSLSTIRKLHEVREVRSEDRPTYAHIQAEKKCQVNEGYAIRVALGILKHRLQKKGDTFSSPQTSIDYAKLQIGDRPNEVFCTFYLDAQHHLIAFEETFQGTIDGCSIHARVIATRCLELQAAAVIFAHNHPSDNPTPSKADKTITARLKSALNLLDVRVLDHLVVTRDEYVSLAQLGEL